VKEHNRPNLPPVTKYKLQDHKVPVAGGEITVRALIPVSENETESSRVFPLLFWIHGGGWMLGNLDLDDFYLRNVCVDLQIVIINVDYRLSPENPFPTGLNDCYAALKWAASNPSLFNVSLDEGFIIAGQSAGANGAAAISHRVIKDPFFDDKPVTGQLLQIPMVCHPDAYPAMYKSELLSVEQIRDAPFLSRAQLDTIMKYLQAPPSDPDMSPLLSAHEGLPPMYAQVCGWDPLRDEGLLYERVLREAGVITKLDIYPGVLHGFHLAFPKIEAGIRFDRDFRNGIRWLLRKHCGGAG